MLRCVDKRRDLRNILRICQILAHKLPQTLESTALVFELKSEVNKLSPEILQINLPSYRDFALSPQLEYEPANYVYCDVCTASSMACSVFGLLSPRYPLPLHDHPNMHGFIKVLRGKFEVVSFSTSCDRTPGLGEEINAVYEGTKVVTPDDDTISLSPANGNLHQIRALEECSYFVDLLVPGYVNACCAYFGMPTQLPAPGSVLKLSRVRQPSYYYCDLLPYQKEHL